MRVAWLTMALLAANSAIADAEPRTVRGVVLPVRAPGASLASHAAAVTDALAARLALPVEPAQDSDGLVELPDLATGLERWADGELDRAAELLDRGLAVGAESPHRLRDAPLFVTAHVARASIALARGEAPVGEHLLRRLVEYDPRFELTADERSPRVERSLLDVRKRLGARPELRVETLGGACGPESTVVVVARSLPNGSTEFLRYDGCRLVASVVATAHEPAADVAASLAPLDEPVAKDRALYESPWFWVGTATVAVLGGAALYFVTRDDPELTIVPHI